MILHPSTGAQSAITGQVSGAFSFGAGMREGAGLCEGDSVLGGVSLLIGASRERVLDLHPLISCAAVG